MNKTFLSIGSFQFIVPLKFIHNSIKGLLALSLVFSFFVLEKISYPIASEAIHSEWILEVSEIKTYQVSFLTLTAPHQVELVFQSIDKSLIFLQNSLVKLILILSFAISLSTMFAHRRTTFPLHIFSSEVPFSI